MNQISYFKNLEELKAILDGLSTEQLKQPLVFGAGEILEHQINHLCVQGEDIYANKDEWEDQGTIEILEECHGKFDPSEYNLIVPKGKITVF
jgi:hypothetical protein